MAGQIVKYSPFSSLCSCSKAYIVIIGCPFISFTTLKMVSKEKIVPHNTLGTASRCVMLFSSKDCLARGLRSATNTVFIIQERKFKCLVLKTLFLSPCAFSDDR